MTSARLWTKSRSAGLYLHTVKSHIGLMVAFFLLLTLTGPLPFIINSLNVLAMRRSGELLAVNSSDAYLSQYTMENLFAFLLVVLIGALVIGLLTTSYMHNRRAMDLYGALPIKREALLLSKSLAGITIILVPYILSSSLFFWAQAALQAYETSALLWLVNLGSFAVYAVGVYVITVFCAVNTGAVFDTAVFTLAMCGAPSIILLLDQAFMGTALVGYQPTTEMNTFILGISPVASSVVRLFNSGQTGGDSYLLRSFALWPIAMALLMWGTLTLYKRRKTELAGTSKSGGVLQIVMKLMAANIAGLLISSLFAGTLSNTWLMATAGFLIGAFVAYFIAEAVLARGFKTFKRMLIQFTAVAGAVIAFTAILYTGAFGYSTRVPTADEVESVTISYSGADMYTQKYMMVGDWRSNGFTEPEVIRQVILAHRAITTSKHLGELNANLNKPDNHTDGILNTYTQITYTLKNGRTVSRSFTATPLEAREAIYGLNRLAAFREKSSFASVLKAEDIISVSRSDMTYTQEQPITRLSQEQAAKLLDAIKTDEAAQSYEQIMTPPARELFELSFNYNYPFTDENGTVRLEMQTGSLQVQPWYKNTIAALRSFGWEFAEAPDYNAISGAYLLQPNNEMWQYWGAYATEETGGEVYASEGTVNTGELYLRGADEAKIAYYKETYPQSPAAEGQAFDADTLNYLMKGRITDKAQIAALANVCVKTYTAQPGEPVYAVAFELPSQSTAAVNNGISSFVTIYLLPQSKAPDFIKTLPVLNTSTEQQTLTTVAQPVSVAEKEKAFQQKMQALKAADNQ